MSKVKRFSVWGKAVQQGSKNCFCRGRRATLVDTNHKALKAWRRQVATVAAETWGTDRTFTGAVSVSVLFVFERPASVRRKHMSVQPDVDKLLRAILDALDTDSNVITNDSSVTVGDVAKVYGGKAHAEVVVREINDGEQVAADWRDRNGWEE